MSISSTHRGQSKRLTTNENEMSGWRVPTVCLATPVTRSQRGGKLDSIVRASSLVEMVNGLLRPSLSSCKGQSTQEALNLRMCSHNHRRYKSGKRQGKAPIALLTGKSFEAPWWELLHQPLNTAQGLTAHDPLP
jgi:hypothetical protein